MWSAAVSFEVDTQDFPVSEDMLPKEGKTLTRSVSYMWRSSAVFNSIEENHEHEQRVGEPMVKSSGERASVIERMYSGPSGMSSGQSQEYKGLVFNLFLKYVLRFIQP